MWGFFPVSFWWVFPLLGLGICFVMMFAMLRCGGAGFGMCMRGPRRPFTSDADTRRDIEALREEIRQLKASR